MENLKDLIKYLSPDERLQNEILTRKLDPIVIIDENYDSEDPFHPNNLTHVLRTELVNPSIYAPIKIEGEDGSIVIYYDIDEKKYYEKRTINDINGNEIIQFKRIRPAGNNPAWEEIDENSLTKIELSYGFSFYYILGKDQICQEPLYELEINRSFKYNPKELEPLENGKIYELNYKDYEGYYNDFGDRLLRSLTSSNIETINSIERRKVTLNYNDRIGYVTQFPRIRANGNNTRIRVRFQYSERIRFLLIFLISPTAIELEFKSIYTYLSFINSTFFSDGDSNDKKYFDATDRYIRRFYDDYLKILDKEFENRKDNIVEILRLILFTPPAYLVRKDAVVMWDILERALKRGANNRGTNKEDAVVKIIQVLSLMETPDSLLDKLFTKKIGSKSFFYSLYDQIDGENFNKYISTIYALWSKSKYAKDISEQLYPNTNGPVYLGYTSRKNLGFFYSNCDVDYDKKKDLLDISLNTGKHTYVTKKHGRNRTKRVREEIVLDYNYHPLYPILIPDLEQQKTAIEFKKVVPAFYLKINEDKTFWSNVITTGEYALDVASTISGVGNIYKFRYLAKVAAKASKIQKTTKVAKFASAASKVQLLTGVVEISSGSLNTLLTLLDLKDSPLGKEIGELLFWLEMVSLTGELKQGIKSGLRKSSINLLSKKGALDELAQNARISLKQQKELIEDIILLTLDKVEVVFLKFKATIDLLKDLKVTITRNINDLDLNSGAVLATPDGGTFRVNYNNLNILEGTKDDVSKFLDKMDQIRKNGGNVRKKIKHRLDELADDINLRYQKFLDENDLVVERPYKGRTNIQLVGKKNAEINFYGKPKELEEFIRLALNPQEKVRNYKKALEHFQKSPNRYKTEKVLEDGTILKFSKHVKPPISIDFKYTPQYIYGGKNDIPGVVKIKLTGNDQKDFQMAFEGSGLSPAQIEEIRDSGEWVWHHLDDFDPEKGTCTMQLVLESVHSKAGHAGGAGLYKGTMKIGYENRDYPINYD